jgi:hypothetical protein
MKYANYIDIPNWRAVQQELINFQYTDFDPEIPWWCYQDDELVGKLPLLHDAWATMGLKMRMLIFFFAHPKDIDCHTEEDERCIFIHQDSQDEPEKHYGTDRGTRVDTDFDPDFAINIPLENCEGSKTFWYNIYDKENASIYYPWHGCGGFKHANCESIYEHELHTPSIIRINRPHGVYNPHSQLRTVATFRFYNDISYLID